MFADHGLMLALHITLALAAAIYAVARTAGLRRRLGLVERSVRRGEGDPGLTDALRRDDERDWE